MPSQVKCWGAEIFGAASCSPEFMRSANHLKDKFCQVCRTTGFLWPASCVVMLTKANSEEVKVDYTKQVCRRVGFWKQIKKTDDVVVEGRLLSSDGTWFTCMFKEPHTHELEQSIFPGCSRVPKDFVDKNGCAYFRLINGTIEMRGKAPRRLLLDASVALPCHHISALALSDPPLAPTSPAPTPRALDLAQLSTPRPFSRPASY